MSAQENARALLYTQMSRGYVRQSEVVKLLAQNGLGTARRLEPIVAGELAAIRKLSVSAMFADAARHGADVEALRQSVIGAMYARAGAR